MKPKIVRITTVPVSLRILLTGQMRFISENGFEVFMVSSAGNTEDIEEREKSKFYPVEMTRVISPIKDLIAVYKLTKLFKKLQPDIIHSHTPKAGIISMLAGKLANVPIRLHTVAGLPLMESTGVKRFVLETVEKIVYACATRVYPNSKNLRQFIVEQKMSSAKKLKVIGNGSSNGINSEFYSPSEDIIQAGEALKKSLNFSNSDFIFVFIGRLVKDKGVIELINAFSKLSLKYNNLKLLLVGPFEQELDPLPQDILNVISTNPSIHNVGFQNDVRPYLAISSVSVFPSYREGFPNVPMQAGCFNLPSIVTNINGCNEIIEHEKNGLIIEAKSEVELSDAMERFFTDSVLFDKCKMNARKMIVDRFEQKYIWNELLQEYKELLSNK